MNDANIIIEFLKLAALPAISGFGTWLLMMRRVTIERKKADKEAEGRYKELEQSRDQIINTKINQLFEDSRKDFDLILDTYRETNETLKKSIDTLKKELKYTKEELTRYIIRLKEAEMRILEIQTERDILLATHLDLPTPQWVVEVSEKQKDGTIKYGKMIMLNDAYEDAFLIPQGLSKADYIGKTHVDVWGQETGNKYYSNDFKALAKKRFVVFKEEVPIAGQDIGDDWLFMKYPLYAGRKLIGIGGIGFPVSLVK
ncbi:MAG: hypothetical protein MJH10_11750 [Epibacterium sp.]|nr:hypothetical protein [Epibacterium sp.]NQX74220.1 hypothetical protein [Epibacterium sp.]